MAGPLTEDDIRRIIHEELAEPINRLGDRLNGLRDIVAAFAERVVGERPNVAIGDDDSLRKWPAENRVLWGNIESPRSALESVMSIN